MLKRITLGILKPKIGRTPSFRSKTTFSNKASMKIKNSISYKTPKITKQSETKPPSIKMTPILISADIKDKPQSAIKFGGNSSMI